LSSRNSLDLVDMRPGTHRIELQAVNPEGTVSPRPAAVTLTILAPLWQRWWFIALALLSAGAAVYFFVRMKVRRRLEMERIRTRIATDLHDDIGSSLTQMSILSEVAVRKLPAEPEAAVEFMSQITAQSRSLVDAMSDIVWAINPARDRFSDLVHRMRRFANDLFAEGGIRLRFNAPGEGRDLALGDDVRRHVYLVFKECLHNVVRHSAATEATVDLRIRGGCLELEIRDNGAGFAPDAVVDGGHGLQSMKRRAEAVRGRLGLASVPGQGTRVLLQVPLASPLGGRWRRSGNCTNV
jgi:signal transduction histidine kinase